MSISGSDELCWRPAVDLAADIRSAALSPIDFDLLISPATAAPAFEVGIYAPPEIAGISVPEFAWRPFCFPFNMTGQPAISVPCGFTEGRLPIGLQIVGHRFEDATALLAAARFQEA